MISRLGGGDRGDIVLGWLVRVVALLAVVGVMAFDGLSIASSRLSIEDQARDAARAAADTCDTEPNATIVLNPKTFSVDRSGIAHVTVTRTAPTFVVRLIPPLRHLAVVHSD